jgi:hypothetical protein
MRNFAKELRILANNDSLLSDRAIHSVIEWIEFVALSAAKKPSEAVRNF